MTTNLTPRERQIVDLILKAYSSKLIARELGIATGTVKLHLNAIYRKKSVNGRVALMVSEMTVK
jgi:DNA-binding CsgD family transcriptional regulator